MMGHDVYNGIMEVDDVCNGDASEIDVICNGETDLHLGPKVQNG